MWIFTPCYSLFISIYTSLCGSSKALTNFFFLKIENAPVNRRRWALVGDLKLGKSSKNLPFGSHDASLLYWQLQWGNHTSLSPSENYHGLNPKLCTQQWIIEGFPCDFSVRGKFEVASIKEYPVLKPMGHFASILLFGPSLCSKQSFYCPAEGGAFLFPDVSLIQTRDGHEAEKWRFTLVHCLWGHMSHNHVPVWTSPGSLTGWVYVITSL